MRPATAHRPPCATRRPWLWRAHLRRRMKPPSRACSEVLRRSPTRGVFMTKIILRGAAMLAVALPGLLAQQPKPKSAEELEALKAMFGAQTADARIAAA